MQDKRHTLQNESTDGVTKDTARWSPADRRQAEELPTQLLQRTDHKKSRAMADFDREKGNDRT